MPRPRRTRKIFYEPEVDYFKPAGVPLRSLKETSLTKDELEAVRLIDYSGETQEKVKKKMNISQPTLSRLLSSARKKISDSLVNGKAIRIQGGNYEVVKKARRSKKPGAGPGGYCICTNDKCQHKTKHKRSRPCFKEKCPKCGSYMTREE